MLVLCEYLQFEQSGKDPMTNWIMVITKSLDTLHHDFMCEMTSRRLKWDIAVTKAKDLRGNAFRFHDDGPSWLRPPDKAVLLGYYPETGRSN